MSIKVTILGCGNSTGVPAIGNNWGICDPLEPKNNRTRCSLALQSAKTSVIVDTGPDFRNQINRENITRINGVLYTHAHSDHVNGIDELRIIRFKNKSLVPIYADQPTMDDLRKRFYYMFEGGSSALYPPMLEPHILTLDHMGKPHHFGDIQYIPFIQDHGTCQSIGYRFGELGYSVDIFNLDESATATLRGIKIWIVDAAAYNQTTNAVHANIQTIYDLNKKIGAEQVYLTSLTLGMDYKTLSEDLKPGYAPAYDGLSFQIKL